MLDLMTLVVKKFYYFFFLFLIISCHSNSKHSSDKFINIAGNAQGTSYSIIYFSESQINFARSFDSILKVVDEELSTYDSLSFISLINRNNDTCYSLSNHVLFSECFSKAINVYKVSNKTFNPALYPIVNYWGFYGSKNSNFKPDSLEVDSLLKACELESCFYLDENNLCKLNPLSKLDFNAIAQGYSVDLIADFLDENNINNYLIEIGGELRAKGKNSRNKFWTVGIDKPIYDSKPGENDFQEIIPLNNKSLATSGNYRKFYSINGKRYAHTIDPFTGYPVNHHLLSATVIADEAYFADAMATSFMVKGLEDSRKFIANNKQLGLKVLFVYDSLGEYKEWKNY